MISLSLVYAEVSIPERTQIKEEVSQIVSYVNEGNFNSISQIISSNARPGLKEEIELQLAEKNIKYEEVLIGSYKEIGNNQIKASGSYEIKGPNWEGSGSLMYFTFERVGDNYLLVDTNFHQIIFPSYIFKKIGSIFLIIIPLLLIISIFWIWMLIDCAKRNFTGSNDKVIWILIIIFTGIVGAIIYYFIVKRKK
jgi:hypothetical protein